MSYDVVMFPTNDPQSKRHRRDLRKNQTFAEHLLWQKLRNEGLGYKFYRQFNIGNYILDFYCNKKKLAIELDGSHHGEDGCKEYDDRRSEYLLTHGIKVIRFWNNEVIQNLNGVTARIKELLDER